jgi:diacylglycerol O-acyltransferase / wax synthase
MSASRFGSPEAVVLLALESAKHPLHIASLQTFTPPTNAGLGFGRQIYEAMRTRTAVAPIFTRHPAPTRRATSGLRWREDAGIDIDYHLRYVALPRPGSNREFFDAISRIHSRHLDRRKPLWEAHVIDGLDDGRFAVYIKTHHALFDGITGIKLLRKSLSTDPNDHDVEVVWSPETNADEAHEVVGQEKVAEAKESAHHFRESVSLIRAALRERDRVPFLRAPRTMLNVASGGARSTVVDSWSLERMTKVARAAGVSVNDVSLAMIAGALRNYLGERNELPDVPLVAMVPVTLRNDDDLEGRNLLGGALCNLGTHVDDPAERLEIVSDSMRYNKKFVRELPRQAALHLAGLLSVPISGGSGVGASIRPIYNLTVSHVPAPKEPLYRNGARLDATHALPPTFRGQALNFGVVNDADNAHFAAVGCAGTVPGVDRVVAHLETSLKDLERSVGL